MMFAPYVHFLESLSDFDFKRFLSQYSKVVVFADENTHLHCYNLLQNHLPKHELVIIKSGEEHKNLNTCTQLWSGITNFGLDRKAIIINLGGGVLGDMGGFCAATYKRGIDFIQIPTTLLSQVDASVGGKLGIDFDDFKNHIGVFQEPKKVLIHSEFLKTLDKRELRSGFAEIIKHALIQDASHWQIIKSISLSDLENFNIDIDAITNHSVLIKSKVVEADPTEKGLRKILNFGHTLGHAIESFYLPQPSKKLLHGEAIAVGMIVEAYLSYKKNYISQNDLIEIQTYILQIYRKITIQTEDIQYIIPLTLQDKKNSHGVVNFSLLKSIGDCNFDIAINSQEMIEALEYYIEL